MAFSAAAVPADPRLRKRPVAAMANSSSEEGGVGCTSSGRALLAASPSSLPIDSAQAQQVAGGTSSTIPGTPSRNLLPAAAAAASLSVVAGSTPPPRLFRGTASASPVAAVSPAASAGPAAASSPLPYAVGTAAPPPPPPSSAVPPPPPPRGCMQSPPTAEGSTTAAAEGNEEEDEQTTATAATKGAWNNANFSDGYSPPPPPPPPSSCQGNPLPAAAAAGTAAAGAAAAAGATAAVGALPVTAGAVVVEGGSSNVSPHLSSSNNDGVTVQPPPPPVMNNSNLEGEGEARGRTKGRGGGGGPAEAGTPSLGRSRRKSSVNSNSRNSSSSSVSIFPAASLAAGGMRLYGRRAAMYHAAAPGVPLPPGATAAGRGIGGKAGRKGVQQQTFGNQNITIVRPPPAVAPVSTAAPGGIPHASSFQTVRGAGSVTPPPPPLPPPPAGGSFYYSYYTEEGDRETGPAVSVANIGVRGRARLQNDYTQHFVDVGERPQNFIRDSEEERRFMEYPKLERLMKLKKYVQEKRNTPSMCIQANLRNFDWTLLGGLKFDVLLVDPPWQEYYDRCAAVDATNEDLTPWSLKDLMHLPLETIGENPSFCFLWCGVMHLEDARLLLAKWGYRRCEDICWLKTNKRSAQKRREQEAAHVNDVLDHRASHLAHDDNTLLQRTTEHCLMGIKGTVRRSQDTHLIHANLDTDILVCEEEAEVGSTRKPEELYDVIERFCLGRRRIELFGRDCNRRAGWVTVGCELGLTTFDAKTYASYFEGDRAWPEATDYWGGRYVGTSPEIEMLRPKSPPRGANLGDRSGVGS